jgi:hypothetical protein
VRHSQPDRLLQHRVSLETASPGLATALEIVHPGTEVIASKRRRLRHPA